MANGLGRGGGAHRGATPPQVPSSSGVRWAGARWPGAPPPAPRHCPLSGRGERRGEVPCVCFLCRSVLCGRLSGHGRRLLRPGPLGVPAWLSPGDAGQLPRSLLPNFSARRLSGTPAPARRPAPLCHGRLAFWGRRNTCPPLAGHSASGLGGQVCLL